LKDRQTKPATD